MENQISWYHARAWKTAVAVTAIAFADDRKIKEGSMQILSTATNYHAGYVDPVWSKLLIRPPPRPLPAYSGNGPSNLA